MPSGKVSRIVDDRGFGFIQGEDGKEYFFHRSGVPGGFESLNVGDMVDYNMEQSDKGPRAGNVRPTANV